MHRTQICLDDWQYLELKALAERSGKSIGSVLRGILTRHLRSRRSTNGTRLRAIEGIIADDARAKDHDRHLYGKPPKRA